MASIEISGIDSDANNATDEPTTIKEFVAWLTQDPTVAADFIKGITNPDGWDFSGFPIGISEKIFEKFGEALERVNSGKLTQADISAAVTAGEKYAAFVNDFAKKWSGKELPAFAKNLLAMFEKLGNGLNEDLKILKTFSSGSAPSATVLSATGNVIRSLGQSMGLVQILVTMVDNWGGDSDTYYSEVGKKTLGVLAGAVAGDVALAALTVTAAPLLAPTALILFAIAGGALAAYTAGKYGEAIWPAIEYYMKEEFWEDTVGTVDAAFDSLVGEAKDFFLNKVGQLDGSWLAGLADLSAEEKANTTAYLWGLAGIKTTSAMLADLKKIFAAPFSDESLSTRDNVLKMMVNLNEAGGYSGERITVTETSLSFTVPIGYSNALSDFREYVRELLDPTDQVGFAIHGSWRVSIAVKSGLLLGTEQNELMLGTAAADTLSGVGGDDELVAGAGDDVLLGGAGSDVLFGQEGNDTLDGGERSDYLYGGEGNDEYRFSGALTSDWIIDSDGKGSLVYEGLTLTGGAKTGEGAYYDESTGWSYIITGDNLTLSKKGSIGYILVKNWKNGDLGINLDDSPSVPDPVQNSFIGDFEKKKDEDGKYILDANGNYVSAGTQAGANDLIFGSAGNDSILGLGGNDALFGRDGDDYIEGGDGFNILQGGKGADTLIGGDGIDYIYGSSNGLGTATPAYEGSPSAGQGTVVATGFGWAVTTLGEFNKYGQSYYLSNSIDRDQIADDDGNIIESRGGNDIVYAGSGSDYVDAGDGDDVVIGMAGQDAIFGGAGDDRLFGDGSAVITGQWVYETAAELHGADVIDGGDGNDTIIGQGGGDVLSGGSGNDLVYGDDFDFQDTPLSINGEDEIEGGSGNDTLVGGARGDVIFGDEDNDRIYGDAGGLSPSSSGYIDPSMHGDDYLDGGTGNDLVMGEGGDDVLYGGGGDDTLVADDIEANVSSEYQGDDYLDGEAGNDYMLGGGGSDTLEGGADDDYLDGDDSEDRVSGAAHGNDYLDGGDGNDTLIGRGGDDVLFGSDGDDYLDGDLVGAEYEGADYLDGGSGNDTLIGAGGDDTLYGGIGDDVLHGDTTAPAEGSIDGDDLLVGGEGFDTLVGFGGNDTLDGGADDDLLIGDGDLGTLAAEAHGNDSLEGGDGNDTLVGGAGSDVLEGGAGNDLMFGDASEASTAYDGDDYLEGGAGYDTLVGGGGQDALFGGDDADVLLGEAGDDYLDGEDGADTLLGGAGDDQLYGGDRDDVLQGDEGDDYLEGGSGVDTLLGGEGNDTLVADGRDLLDGGAGDDVYVISAATLAAGKTPLIVDESGTNTIDISAAVTGEVDTFIQVSVVNGSLLVQTKYGTLSLDVSADLSKTLIDFGHGGKSLEDLLGDSGGRVKSGSWDPSTGVLTPTDEITLSQSLYGTDLNEDMLGGSGSDKIFAGGGDDLLLGGAGNDSMTGDSGADTLRGGDGNDVLNGNLLNGSSDGAVDVYEFNVGDGNDWIVGTGGGAEDVIRFGEGVALADLQVTNLRAGTSLRGVHLQISYGDGDTITLDPGAEGTIERIEFSDGTWVSMSDLVAPLIEATPDIDGIIQGTNTDDVLLGTAGADRIEAKLGNDTLQGGQGNDVLIGGGGSNTYRFSEGDGRDFIAPTSGESAMLSFGGAITVVVLGTDLLIQHGNGDSVRISGGAANANVVGNWQIQIDGFDPVSLASLIPPTHAGAVSLTDREVDFIEKQAWQLTTDPQTFSRDTGEGLVPISVAPIAIDVVAGETTVLASYLDMQDVVRTVTKVITEPVYAPVDRESTTVLRFIPLKDLEIKGGGGWAIYEVPSNGWAVYEYGAYRPGQGGNSELPRRLIGYYVPVEATSPGTVATDNRIIGYETYTVTTTEYVRADQVTQATVTGTTADDVIVSGPDSGQYATSFRGTIHAGDGNDRVELNSVVMSNYGYSYNDGYQDWGVADHSTSSMAVSNHYDRGLGAWIDLGAGDDVAYGTEANDVLIGGAGNDWLDGQAGADAYLISGHGTDVDRIYDQASFRGSTDQTYLSYGGSLQGNQDTVEFDDGVQLASLSYRWSAEDPDGGLKTLQLFVGGRLFLQIDYAHDILDLVQSTDSQVGVELFKFADGTALTLSQLLQSASERPEDGVAMQISGTSGNDLLYGGTGGDSLQGGAGDDYLAGGAGADLMEGGDGDDRYAVDDAGDQVVEATDGGWDSVIASMNHELNANVEALQLAGMATIGIGNELDNEIRANDLGNQLEGKAGNDYLVDGAGNDLLLGGEGNDTLDGGAGNDTLAGGGGDDRLTDWNSESSDTFRWGLGDGADYVLDRGGEDRLEISDVAADDLLFQQVDGYNLQISIAGTTDTLTVDGWFMDTSRQLESIVLDDGTTYSASDVQALVEAMASFNAGSDVAEEPVRYHVGITPQLAASV